MADQTTAPTPFTYRAKHLRTVDGDTVHLSVEVGFGLDEPDVDVRLRGLNAPEIRGVDDTTKIAGLKARTYVDNALSSVDEIRLQTYAKDDFGRWIGNLWYHHAGQWHHLNQELLDRDLAVPYMGPVDPTIPGGAA